jgi:hypothetical protein
MNCGLNEGSLETAVIFVLQQSRLQVVPVADSQGTIFVNVTVLPSAGGGFCFASSHFTFQTFVTGKSVYGTISSDVTTFSKGQVYSFSRVNFPKQLSDAVEAMTKQFVAAWIKDN